MNEDSSNSNRSLYNGDGNSLYQRYDRSYPRPRYDSYPYSSSPLRSTSSPPLPGTPCIEKHGRDLVALIRSSPDYFYPDVSGRERGLDVCRPSEDFSSSSPYSWKAEGVGMYNNSRRARSISTTTDEYPPTSDYDPFEEEEEMAPDAPSFWGDRAMLLSDDDNDEQEIEDIFEFGNGITASGSGYSGYGRTTFFRTSAERGLWKKDPIPSRSSPRLLKTRQSASMLSLSRIPAPTVMNTRTVSEPAPSSFAERDEFFVRGRVSDPLPATDCAVDLRLSSSSEPSSAEPIENDAASPYSIASFVGAPSSPLPPSSPPPPLSSPPLSPLPLNRRRSISVLSRGSISSLSCFGNLNERGWSPLSELSDDDDDVSWGVHLCLLNPIILIRCFVQVPMPNLKNVAESGSDHAPVACTELGLGLIHGDRFTENGNDSSRPPHKLHLQLLLPLTGSDDSSLSSFSSLGVDSKENGGVSCGMEVGSDGAGQPSLSALMIGDDVLRKSEKSSGALKERNGVVHRPLVFSQASSSRSSSVVGSGEGTVVVKKRKVAEVVNLDLESTASSGMKDKKMKTKGKKRIERDDEEDVENDGSPRDVAVGPKHKRRRRAVGSGSNSNPKAAKRATTTTSKRRGGRAVHDEEDDEISEPLDAEAKELHATICGMVIETMATSRASSLPVSSIYRMVMNSQPSLKNERTECEWLRIFGRVLRDGEAGRGSGVFAKVESSGKDETGRSLEAQWFYVPERDEDQERALLIRSMMPRPAKRSETMKYKQYYWRPLAKISKWDPEDAL